MSKVDGFPLFHFFNSLNIMTDYWRHLRTPVIIQNFKEWVREEESRDRLGRCLGSTSTFTPITF